MLHEAKLLINIADEGYFLWILGIPSIFWYGVEGDFNIMVMELLGLNLEDLLATCNKKFTLKTTIMLGDQMVDIMII